ncbi:hypothetical protein BV898_18468 [Hypsibius exemplaris]|uniref:Uncharacterized protein n=1 Tax=Hypsibius exemplaris TaxID=2072580 RepID=A0A9X6NJR4_HYPEX|nr:hypothetical protein BV898_18468 [Hypsibius exemplaris]
MPGTGRIDSVLIGMPHDNYTRHAINLENALPYKRGPLGCCGFSVVNVSSPNTPGLRVHQQRDKLDTLLRAKLDGLVISNTTTTAGKLNQPTSNEIGGLAVAPAGMALDFAGHVSSYRAVATDKGVHALSSRGSTFSSDRTSFSKSPVLLTV